MENSSKISVIISIFSFIFLNSCDAPDRNKTPKEFINYTMVKKGDYTKDSLEVTQQLKGFLNERKDFFENWSYFDSTQIIIDSIIYAPDFNKLAVFLITKNPESRQLQPSKNYSWYYDATCYLGVRQNGKINLSWMGPSFTNSHDKIELSKLARDYYFTDVAIKDSSQQNAYKYNLNDVRFWKSVIWNKLENKKIKELEFELEKKNHPENVYEHKIGSH